MAGPGIGRWIALSPPIPGPPSPPKAFQALPPGFLAESLGRIQPSPTLAVTQKARDLKAAGKDVIGLGAGEPDFDTPDNIKEAAIAAIRRGETKYTAVEGIPELRKAIAGKFKRENDLDYAPAQTFVSPGGKSIIYNAHDGDAEPGRRGDLRRRPIGSAIPTSCCLAGAKPVIVEAKMEDGFRLTPEALEARHHAEDEMADLQPALQPDGRLLHAQRSSRR